MLPGTRKCKRFCRRISPLGGMLLLAACTTTPLDPGALPDDAAACLADYEALDRRLASAELHDQGAYRVAGFPWLRSNRFIASFRDELDGPELWRGWLAHLAREDLEARRYELANLKTAEPHSETVGERVRALKQCSERLNDEVLSDPALQISLRSAAEVPDEYRTGMRWLGMYPLTRLPVLVGVNRLHSQQSEALATSGFAEDATEARQWLAQDARSAERLPGTARADWPRDSLGIPRPDTEALTQLYAKHAPVWRIAQDSPDDRLGQPEWSPESTVRVDTDEPVEYRFLSFTRFHGRILPQLNYMVWLPARPRQGVFDLLGGHLDGLIWRVTLTENGEVLAAESLHSCGCYYMVFPGSGAGAADTRAAGEPISSTELSVRPAEALRSLPHPDGRRSLYGQRGLIKGSERRERWAMVSCACSASRFHA